MKLTLITCLFSAIIIIGGCKNKGHKEEFSAGTVENGKYINKFFGFTLDIPDTWYVYNEQELKEVSGALENDENLNTNGKKLIKKGKVRSAELLMTQIYNPYAFDAIVNPTLFIITERIDDAIFIRNAEDYMRFLRKNSQQMVDIPLDFTDQARVELNGNFFDRHTIEKVEYGYKYKITQFCKIMNGYAVLFSISYADEYDRKKLVRCLSSLKYKN
jgi:hypothetical protein